MLCLRRPEKQNMIEVEMTTWSERGLLGGSRGVAEQLCGCLG